MQAVACGALEAEETVSEGWSTCWMGNSTQSCEVGTYDNACVIIHVMTS